MAKNLMQLSKAQLEKAAEHFGVDGDTKREIVDALQEREVTMSDYITAFGDDDDEDDKPDAAQAFKDAGDQVIVKMTRQNPYYQTHGFTFTKIHPFVVMTRGEANILMAEEEGFRLSTADEAQDYYDK